MATVPFSRHGGVSAGEQEATARSGERALHLPTPSEGQNFTLDMVPGSDLQLSFNPGEATVTRSGNDLEFSFDNEGTVTIRNFFVVEEGKELPDLILPEGDSVPAALIFADSGLDLSTAAGPAAGAALGGGTSYDDDSGALLLGLDKYGMLGTDYWGRETERTEDYQGLERPGGSFGLGLDSDLGAAFGIRGGVYEDALPWQHQGDRESFVPGQLTFTFYPSGSTVVTGIHLSGFHAGTVIYFGDPSDPDTPRVTVSGPDQILDFTQEDFANGVYLVPPKNSDANMDINAVVDVVAGSSGLGGTISGGFTVIVDAVADRPDLDAASAVGDSSGHVASDNKSEENYDQGFNKVQSTVSAGEGEGGATVTVTVSATFEDYEDGSELHYLLVQTHDNLAIDPSALPDGYTYLGTIVIDGTEYHQIGVDNGLIAQGGGSVSLPVVFDTVGDAGEKTGQDQKFDLKVGAYAEEDVDPSGEIDLGNNTAHIVSEDGEGVSAVVDVVNGTLNVSVGWAYEGNDGSKHLKGGYSPSEDDYAKMDGGDGIDPGSTGANGAPISIGLEPGSADGSAEFITSAEFSFPQDRGELLVDGRPVTDGMEVSGADGVTYTFAVDAQTGAVTVTVGGGHVSSLDELNMSFRPTQTGDQKYNDQDVELSYKVTVENEAGAKGQFEGKTEIVIDAVADKPVGVGGAGVDYSQGDGNEAAMPGQEVGLSFKATFPDTDGSETHTIFINLNSNNRSATHNYGDHIIDAARISEINGIAGTGVLSSGGEYLELTMPPLDQFVNGVYVFEQYEPPITVTYDGNGQYTVSGIQVTMPDLETLTDGNNGNAELAENGDTALYFPTVAWAHEEEDEKGSGSANNEHDLKNNDAFSTGSCGVRIATVGGDAKDFTLGDTIAFETDMPHNNQAENPQEPAGSDNNSTNAGGTGLSVTWDFADSKEYVSEIVLTVPVDRWGNPVGDIYYKGELVEPGLDGKYHIEVTGSDRESGIKDGDLTFVPKGHESGNVSIGVEAEIHDPRSGDHKTENAGTINVAVDAVANRSGEVTGEASYGDDLSAVASGEPVTIVVGTTFTDNDGSERHFVLVEQKPHWQGEYDVEYYDLDGDGTKEPYFKVPVPSAPPEGAGDDYPGDAHHLSSADWATLCSTGTVTTENGVTISIPKGPDGAWDPSGEWTVKAEATLDPPVLEEGSHEIGTGSLVEEYDVNHATENRGEDYKDNNVAMRPGQSVEIEVNNTEGISVTGDFLYEAGDEGSGLPEQNGLLHIAPSSGDDSFFGSLEVSVPSGHGVFYYDGVALDPDNPLEVTLYDRDGKPVEGVLSLVEENGTTSVVFTPKDPDAAYPGLDLELRLDATDHSDTDIEVSVTGNLRNDKSGQETGGVGGKGEVVVDAVARAPEEVPAEKDQQEPLVPGGDKGVAVTLTATFDDVDGSEEHFFLLEAKPGHTYTFTVNGETVTVDITSDWPTVLGPDGKPYFKIPASPDSGGKASLEVTVKVDGSYRGGENSEIKYGAMSEDSPTDDGEKTYDNNIDFNVDNSLDIAVDLDGGGGPISVGPAYEDNRPNAHTGDDTQQFAKVTLPTDAEAIRLHPGEGCAILVKEGDTWKELKPDADGWVTVPADKAGDVYFKAPDGYSDTDQKLGYEITGGSQAGKGQVTVLVDAVAQQGSVAGAEVNLDAGRQAVGQGPVTVEVKLSGLVDQDGSTAYYVLIEARPGWECPDGELVLLDGKAYFRVPVAPEDIDGQGNATVNVTLKTPPAGADGTVTEELAVGSMAVDTPGDKGEDRMDNNVAVNVNGSVEITKSVAEPNLSLSVSEGYEDNIGGTASIDVSGVGNNDVVTEIHFSVDPAEGLFTYDGKPIGPEGYSDDYVKITVSTGDDGRTVISITPGSGAQGFSEDDLKAYINDKLGLAVAGDNHSSADIVIEWGYTVKDTLSGDEAVKDDAGRTVVVDAVAHKPELTDYDVNYGDGRQAAEPGDDISIEGTVRFTANGDESNYVLVEFSPGWEVNGITVTVGGKSIHYTAEEVRDMDLFYPNGSNDGGAYYKVPLQKGDTDLSAGTADGDHYDVRVKVDTEVPSSGIKGDGTLQLGIGGAAVDSYGDGESSLSNNVASDTGNGDGIRVGIVDSTDIWADVVAGTPGEGGGIALDIHPEGGNNDVITGLTLTNSNPDSGFFYYDGERIPYDDQGRAVLPPEGLGEEDLKNWSFDSDKLEFLPDERFDGTLDVKVEATVSDADSGASRDGFETGFEIEVAPQDLVIHGGAGDDILIGANGNDIIFAGSENVLIVGGGGNDTLYGGSGEDTFFWEADHFGRDGATAHDVVNDFTYGEDVLHFSDVFGEDMDLSSLESILGFLNNDKGAYENGTLELRGDSCTISASFGEDGVSLNIERGDSRQSIEVNFSGTGYENPADAADAAEILAALISQGAL